jgi:hypothetical protein
MKYVVLESFKADYRHLSTSDQAIFRTVLPDFVAACDRYAVDPAARWPASLRVKPVQSAPGIWEMTWSFAGPDGRATFEWVQVEGGLALRWRRIGDHGVLKSP